MREGAIRTVRFAIICMALGLLPAGVDADENGASETHLASTRTEWPRPAISPEDSAKRGLRDAKKDLANGKIQLRSSGLPPHYRDGNNPESMYKGLLHQRTGLELVNVGCVITPSSKTYDQAYNHEVKSWLTNQFGADVFSRARSDSRQAYEAYRKDKRRRAKAQKEKTLASDEYQIQPGDTFYAIAKRNGCSVQSLITVNEGLDPRRLQVGQRIKLPTRPAN